MLLEFKAVLIGIEFLLWVETIEHFEINGYVPVSAVGYWQRIQLDIEFDHIVE